MVPFTGVIYVVQMFALYAYQLKLCIALFVLKQDVLYVVNIYHQEHVKNVVDLFAQIVAFD